MVPPRDTPSSPSHPPRSIAATLVVVAVFVAIVFGSASTEEAIWSPQMGDHPGFSPVDAAAAQPVWPLVGTADGVGATLTDLGEAIWLVGGDGEAVAPFVFAGVAIALLAVLVVQRLEGSLPAAAACALALSLSGLIWSRVVGLDPITYAGAFGIAALAGLLAWLDTRRPRYLVAATVSYGLAVAVHPIALVALPVLIGTTALGGFLPVAFVLAAAIAGGSLFWAASYGGATPFAWFGAPADLGFAGPVDGAAGAVGTLFADFGVLGVVFLGLGLARLAVRPAHLVLLAGWALSVVAYVAVWAPPDVRTLLGLAFLPLWLIVGAGMASLVRLASTPRGRWGAVMLVWLMPAMTFIGHYDIGSRARFAAGFMDRYVERLREATPSDLMMVAEGGVIDRGASRQGRRNPPAWPRLAQDPDAVRGALERGRPVLAFAGATSNLRELGFRFARVEPAGVPMALPELLASIPSGWIVAVAMGQQFASEVLPDEPSVFRPIGATGDLFGRTRWHYGLIGIRGHDAVLTERLEPGDVDLEVKAGEALSPRARSPVQLRVVSRDGEAFVEFGSRRVASTRTGLALAVVTPTGQLKGAFDTEFFDEMRFVVEPPTLAPALVSGREPCVDAPVGQWTDVSSVAALSSVGALLGPGQHVVIYAGNAHALSPRLARLGPGYVPALALATQPFATGDAAARTLLERALEADGLDAATLGSHRYVLRVEVPGGVGHRQLALRLGGFADAAHLHVEGPDETATLEACAAMRAIEALPVSRSAAATVVAEVEFSQDDLFVAGWGRVELPETAPLRWTTAPTVELLLPLARAEPLVLALDAEPVTGEGPSATVGVRINTTDLEPVALSAGRRVYRWEVAADVWREGLNRVWLSTSTLLRPSEVSGSQDDRLLGMAVRGLRLERPPDG